MLPLTKEKSRRKRLQKPPACHEESEELKQAVRRQKQTAAITDDEITGAMARSSHDYLFAVTEKPSLGNHAVR